MTHSFALQTLYKAQVRELKEELEEEIEKSTSVEVDYKALALEK